MGSKCMGVRLKNYSIRKRKRNWIITFLFCFVLTQAFSQNTKYLKANSQTIFLADPTIFENEGTYYLYGTNNDPSLTGQGFLVYTSKDLKDWKGPVGAKGGFALKKGDAFGTKGFWAPQVFEYNGKFYMAYTANENIAIATADSPLGPFSSSSAKALEAPVKQIDPFVFIDEDGKKYLYHVRLQDGNRIFVAEMNHDLKSIKTETLREIISGEEEWENTQNVKWPVTEGPTVIKHQDFYYLIYSANDFRNPDYAVGYATSKSPLGPWEKAKNNPFITRTMVGENGPGHGDIFRNSNDELLYVFHTHASNEEVHPRKTAITKLKFGDSSDIPVLKVDNERSRN